MIIVYLIDNLKLSIIMTVRSINMNKEELKLMQNYPLWMKVEKTKQRIREWYE